MSCPDIILELPLRWFRSSLDGERHQRFYLSIWQALSELGVTVRPIAAVYGADDAPRLSRHGQLVISFHSRGPAGSVLRLKESYLPPYYTADRMGYSGFSELARYPERFAAQLAAVDPKAAARFVADLKEQVVATNLSKYSQRALGAVNLPETYVFMPLQTVDDPVAGLCVVPQLDALEWLLETTAALGWGAVVKRHPLCRSKEVETRLELLAQRHAHLLHSEASVHQLISGAEAVFGANSGVLFEALVHGAHVVSFAGSDFQTAVTQVSRRSEIAGAILGSGRLSRMDQCRFLFWYLTRYCLHADDIEAIRNRIATALAAQDIKVDRQHHQQRELFKEFARQEGDRRKAIRDL